MAVKFSRPAIVAGLVLTAAAGVTARAVAQESTTPVSDSGFVQMAGSGGMAEVQLGKLAQKQASSSDVKQFGQRMVTDHTRNNQQLMAAAQNAGLTPPTAPLPKHRQVIARLSGQTGTAFDTAYMAAMVKDHAETVQLFQQESKAGQSEALRQVASEALPVLQQHLTLAKQVAGKVGADTTAAAAASHADHNPSSGR